MNCRKEDAVLVFSVGLGQSSIQLSLQTDSLSADEDRASVRPDERAFQDAARLQTWCWQYLGSCSEVHQFTAHPGECDGKLRSVVIRTGEVVENARRLRAESASKGRICRKGDDFC